MPGTCAQLRLLFWKNWVLKKRSWGSTLFEFVIPLVAIFLLLLIRYEVDIEDIQQSTASNHQLSVPDHIFFNLISYL